MVGMRHAEGHPGVLQPLLVLARRLFEEHRRVARRERDVEVPGRGLRRFHEIVDEALQPHGLPREDLRVFPHLLVPGILLREQVGVIDNRGERRLDVVRDVRDKLGLHPLALHALLHGAVHPDPDAV